MGSTTSPRLSNRISMPLSPVRKAGRMFTLTTLAVRSSTSCSNAWHATVVSLPAEQSNYNNSPDKTLGIKNWFEVIPMRLEIRGFIVIDHLSKAGEALDKFKKALADGKLQVEGGEQIVKASFEEIPKTWMQLFSGSNTGKLITALQ